MTRRTRRLVAALGAAALLLFVGRWASSLLAERWWVTEVAPRATGFVTQWHLLRAVLEVGAVAVASGWFIGHLLIVYRAVGSVQVRRNVANLEFREALTPGALLAAAVGAGVVLGVLTGAGAASAAPEVALGWQGVTYGVTDPLLQRDLGLYVAQVPLWRAVHDFAFLLVILALGLVFALYLLVGAVRWMDGRPAINGHARSHLGWLLATLALTLMWGYLLEPYELIAGLDGTADRALWRGTILAAPVLAGVALATALLSAIWAMRARHALAAAGWIVLPVASLVGHWMVPSAMGGEGERIADTRTLDQLGRMAYGLEALTDQPPAAMGRIGPPRVPSLWSPAMVSRSLAGDSVEVVSVNAAVVPIAGRRAPAWLATRTIRGGLTVSALADDRTGPGGEPLFYRLQDTVPVPVAVPLVDLGDDAFHPASPRYRIGRGDVRGVKLGQWPRRLLLAWALQAPELLGSVPAGSRVDWALSPKERLAHLAPFAEWGEPIARIVDGDLVWVLDGYLPTRAFPLSERLEWNGRRVAGLRAAFVGTVAAQGGAAHVYLRRRADALATSWAAVARGLVEAASALPEAVWRAAPYPAELLRVQARVLERSALGLGTIAGRATPDADPPRPEQGWAPDTVGPVLTMTFERPGERRLSAVLTAAHEEESDLLRLTRFDSSAALPSRSTLEGRWNRFPSYDALLDSVRDEGGQLDRGPLRLDAFGGRVLAYQPYYAGSGAGRPALVWVSMATDDRLGAGRTMAEAWNNLVGASVPSLAGPAQTTRFEEARRVLLRADSALRAADWEAFGQAWSDLRRALGVSVDSAAP